MVSWSTVTITMERPEHVRAFVAWHLGAGAEEILLYYDDPDGPVNDFYHLPQVKLTLLDTAHWAPLGGRPDNRLLRQIHAATTGYNETRSDWICHCDIDEFVFGNTISGILQDIPAQKTCARLKPIERIFNEDEIHQHYTDTFRTPLTDKFPDWLPEIYTNPNILTNGVSGHRNGKVFARTGLKDAVFFPHNIQLAGVRQNQPKFCETLTDVKLLHLFTFGFEHYKSKGEWKYKHTQQKQEQNAAIENPSKSKLGSMEMAVHMDANDENLLLDVFNDIYVFSSERLETLSKHQEIQTFIFTKILEARLRKFFP